MSSLEADFNFSITSLPTAELQQAAVSRSSLLALGAARSQEAACSGISPVHGVLRREFLSPRGLHTGISVPERFRVFFF